MILRRLTDFILQGRVQAMAVAFLCSYLPLIGILSIVIAGLVTLRKGAFEGLLVTIAATIPYLLLFAMYPNANEVWLVGVLVISNVLTWMFAIALARFSNWSLIIDSALVLGLAVVVAVHIFFPTVQFFWEEKLSTFAEKSFVVANGLNQPEATQKAIANMVQHAKQYATGFATAAILLNVLLQVLVARWWQAVIFNPGGLQKELHVIRLSYFTGLLFVLILGLSFWGWQIATDCMPVVYGAYGTAGLSVLHFSLQSLKTSWLALSLIYLGLLFFFTTIIVMLALLGLLDTTLDFRKKLRGVTWK